MFGFLKKKNKLKELECRIAELEVQVTTLNRQNGIFRVYNGLDDYKKGKFTLEKLECSCQNCNGGAVLPLKNDEFISKLSNEFTKVFKESKSNESTVDLVLEIDKTEIGKIIIDSINKVQRQGGTKLLRI